MKETITEWAFRDRFKSIRPDNFSYEGLGYLFNWLEEYEEDTGEQIELDVIAICCDYTEFGSWEELKNSYPGIKDLEDLQDHTSVIACDDDCIIIRNF